MAGGRPPKDPALRAVATSFKLPSDVLAALRARADRERVHLTAVVVSALRVYLAPDT
jgi:hypothetical protein